MKGDVASFVDSFKLSSQKCSSTGGWHPWQNIRYMNCAFSKFAATHNNETLQSVVFTYLVASGVSYGCLRSVNSKRSPPSGRLPTVMVPP